METTTQLNHSMICSLNNINVRSYVPMHMANTQQNVQIDSLLYAIESSRMKYCWCLQRTHNDRYVEHATSNNSIHVSNILDAFRLA